MSHWNQWRKYFKLVGYPSVLSSPEISVYCAWLLIKSLIVLHDIVNSSHCVIVSVIIKGAWKDYTNSRYHYSVLVNMNNVQRSCWYFVVKLLTVLHGGSVYLSACLILYIDCSFQEQRFTVLLLVVPLEDISENARTISNELPKLKNIKKNHSLVKVMILMVN